jgi:hypothetical protein
MKTTKQRVAVNSPRIGIWVAVGAMVMWAPLTSLAINAVPPGLGDAQPDAKAAQTVPAPRYSPGVVDIVKLVDAKVDAEVIKTYIKNSPTAYNPNASELIALKDRGVAPEILTAMLQRGAEVRAQGMQPGQVAASPVAPQVNPGAVAPYAPAYDYGAQPVYPNYGYSYPVNSYAYPAYDYAYPGYSYGYWWPPLSIGFGFNSFRAQCGFGNRFCFGGRGFAGHGGRAVPFAGRGGGFHSFGGGARSVPFASHAGGFRGGGGFGGHAVSFGGGRGGGGFGGHSMGRGR